jgi:transposase
MDLREQHGMELAAIRKVLRKGELWSVPSGTGDGKRYTVDLVAETCSCPDFHLHRVKCKHIFAAFYVRMREEHPEGSVSVTIPMNAKRKTYPQNWRAYNKAQRVEKKKFQILLHELCAGVPVASATVGRPSLPLPDAIFSVTFKVYSTFSARRFNTDLEEAYKRGLLSKLPCPATVLNVMGSDSITPVLRSLVERSALPLRGIESTFAVDSTSVSTSRFRRWVEHSKVKELKMHEWVKFHMMCGVKTNIVTAVEIRDPNAADTNLLPLLLATTAKNFNVTEVLGDKGYASKKNLEIVAAAGAVPFILFRESDTGAGGGKWGEMFHYFTAKREEFLKHYHKRSNAEATFSMLKRKFMDNVRSKTDVAMKNETLCKILCHNIVVLIHAMHELGIDPVFWDRKGMKQ